MSRRVAPVAEVPVRLIVNGLDAALWTCTPADLEALGAGRLLAMGFVRDRPDLASLETDQGGPDEPIRITAQVAAARAASAIEERDHVAGHGCGLRHFLDCRPDLLGPAGTRAPLPEAAAFAELFRQMYAGATEYHTTGGLHAACLSDGSGIGPVHEEVARHNAVDKSIGAAWLAGSDLAGLGLVTTARISGEIAMKSARAGLAWIASRSVPTTLALEIATVSGLPIVARAARPESRVFEGGPW